jgi:hypothetical protein
MAWQWFPPAHYKLDMLKPGPSIPGSSGAPGVLHQHHCKCAAHPAGAWFCSTTPTGLAYLIPGDFNFPLNSKNRLLKGQVDIILKVTPTPWGIASTPAGCPSKTSKTPEKFFKQVGEINGEIRNPTHVLHTCMTKAIICSALFRLRQYCIRFIDFLKRSSAFGSCLHQDGIAAPASETPTLCRLAKHCAANLRFRNNHVEDFCVTTFKRFHV